MKILILGASGFVGSNLHDALRDKHTVYVPKRSEIDTSRPSELLGYVTKRRIEIIVNCANPNPAKNAMDRDATMFVDSLGGFLNVFELRDHVRDIFYFGSGAEYDKRFDIRHISETDAGRSLPSDQYGRAKYVMNALARESSNVTNLRLFACYGPRDHHSKFITHCIRSVLLDRDITIRQDCMFDYLHVSDVARTVDHFIEHRPQRRDYNVASGRAYLLSDIAALVLNVMRSPLSIMVERPGLNKEYTADVSRLEQETSLVSSFITLREGIQRQVRHERERRIVWGRGQG